MINFDTGRLSIRVRCTLNRDQGKEGLGVLGGWGAGLAGGLGGWGAGGLGAPNFLNGQKKNSFTWIILDKTRFITY